MTATTTETLTVDGVNLKTLATNVESLAATLRSAGRRGANAIVAGRDGSLYTPYKPVENGIFTLPMWIAPCDVDEGIPGGSNARKEFYKNLDMITALFDKDYGLLDVRHTLPDGTIRQAMCDVLTSIDFTTQGVNPIAKFVVELINTDSFWKDVTLTNANSSLINSPWTWATGGTAPVNDAVYTVTGPITNPRVTDEVSGAYLQYGGTVAGGQTLVMNASNFNITGTGGLVPNFGVIVYNRTGGRLMRLTPSRTALLYRVRLTGSGTSGATNLAISGYKKYKVG